MSFLALLLTACDHDGLDFFVKDSTVPGVVNLGELDPIPMEDVQNNSWVFNGLDGLLFGQLGQPDTYAEVGGATFQFKGTGGKVCLIMDPEMVYWNQGIELDNNEFLYEDRLTDDGDLDMFAGLSAYYTGSPGVDIGTFELPYTDPLGEEHFIDFQECNRDYYPSGRATYETCELDTVNRAGISFTVLLQTFMLPIDDGVLNFGVAVMDGPCEPDGAAFRKSECTIQMEDGMGEDVGNASLEEAFCAGEINAYCEAHLGEPNAPCTEGYIPAR